MKKGLAGCVQAGVLGVLLALPAVQVWALGLLETWQWVVEHDQAYAAARQLQQTAQPQRDQAAALWKPMLSVTGSLGIATDEVAMHGAQFSAPAFGQSTDVGFTTSVTNGTATQWALTAAQPLYNPRRSTERQQLFKSADLVDLQWQQDKQALMLRTVERYFDSALADVAVQVYGRQLEAVQKAAEEVMERFRLGDVAVTDTHEAQARAATLRAQWLTADHAAWLKRQSLADSTGLPPEAVQARLPVRRVGSAETLQPLEHWLEIARIDNLQIRSQKMAAEVASRQVDKQRPTAGMSVDVVAQVGRDRLHGQGDFGSASNTRMQRMIGLQMRMPLYTGGYRSALQAQAQAEARQAWLQLEHLREQVMQQVRRAWLGLSIGRARVGALEAALKANLSRRDATRLGREVGERTTLDLLDAENEVAASRLALLQGRIEDVTYRLQLTALIGQLDESALGALDERLAAEPID
ncbi:TolC family protein [Sinimarinibacterium sp. NLF-5-8]|uniref:TolC family protein n=1 Tax=Sinimarinibacterium sp. NLF-5-8 TaxID=2698684 RepID=UPI00137C227C|nr:TolC family protein [Sinimarinibacterium sp. NLF-5-8]QHS10971.1 TolC family protein [Sinimarinibacterium sp. NLF-5-8]